MNSHPDRVYCQRCKRSFALPPDALHLMGTQKTALIATPEGYRFDGGCFFKILAERRRNERKSTAR